MCDVKGFQIFIDQDGDQAKKCLDLDCGKTFYIGEECPFCKGKAKGEQNLIKAFCPDCKKKAKNLIGVWVDVFNPEALPDNLTEERCPSCTLDKVNDCPEI